MASVEPLRIVLGPHGQVQDLRNGSVPVDGHALEFVEVKRMPDAYREMARTQPYAISEMAPTAYLMALAAGAPITALPIPMTRRFRHAGLMRTARAAGSGPKGIEGRAVGVRSYSVTAAVWTRGVYADDFGVDLSRVRWLTQEGDNVATYVPPANVHSIDAGTSLSSLLQQGDLEFAFAGLAGAGNDPGVELVDVVGDAEQREPEWYRRTGIYPIHGVIVVRNDMLSRWPDLAPALWTAFVDSKTRYLARLHSGEAAGAEDKRYLALEQVVGKDPLPYGLDENARTFEALVRYAHEQRLVDGRPSIDQLFVDPRASTPRLARWNQ